MMLKQFVILCFLLAIQPSYSQDLKIFQHFDEMEKELFVKNDTCYVINFWATWCVPCVKELPYFEALNKEIKDQKIKIILVSLDFKNQIETHLKPFIKDKKYSTTFALLNDKDYNNWLSKVDGDWSGAIPATLLIQGNKKLFAERDFESIQELKEFVYSFVYKP